MSAGFLAIRGVLRLVLLVFACYNALCRDIPMDPQAMYKLTAADMKARHNHSWPNNPLYADPWVRQNIAITYAHKTRDGVGAQTMRLIGLYAIARSLNLRYLHRPIQCVGHVDGKVHFRGSDCGYLSENDQRLMNKIRHMVTLPSNVTEAEVQNWDNIYIEYVGWSRLTRKIRAAFILKRPTLLTIEFPTYLVQTHPDMYLSVPAFKPEQPSARLVCRAAQAADKAITPGRSWLLNALRIAVHFRRGDIAEDKRWHDRMLPPSYYVNVVKRIVEVMDEVGCDFAVELYTETPSTPEGEAELYYLKQHMPASVMLISTDLAWSWQMMSTADVLIMSNSAFSLSAAIMNPNALNIFFPNAKKKQARINLDHWFTPTDVNGTLPQEAVVALRARLQMFKNVTESDLLQAQVENSHTEQANASIPLSISQYGAAHMPPAPAPATAATKSATVPYSLSASSSSSNGSSTISSNWQQLSDGTGQQIQQSLLVPAATPLQDTAAAAATAVQVEEDAAPDAAPVLEEQALLTEDAFGDYFSNLDTGVASSAEFAVATLPGAVLPVAAPAASFSTNTIEQMVTRR